MERTAWRILTAAAIASGAAPLHAVVVARAGKPAVPIVIAETPKPPERFAAEELATHLEKVTGGTFRTVAEAALPPDTPAIFVGHTEFAAAAGIDAAAMGDEEWLLRTAGNSLVLNGGRPRGTLYAVYEFLERELGVAWLSEEVTLTPKRGDLAIGSLDRQGAPAFSTMRWIYTDLRGLNHVPEFIERMETFHCRNKVGDAAWLWSRPRYGVRQLATASHSHSFYAYIPPDTYFDDHPEWFSVNVNGDRMRSNGQLCLTNPDMTAEVIRRMREFIEEDRKGAEAGGYPPARIYELSMNDSHMMCQCPDCRAVVKREGAESGLVLAFVNAVAEAIAKDHPQVAIRTFAYSLTFRPPKTIRPRDNVIMMLAYLADSATGHNWRCPAKPLAHDYHSVHKTVTDAWREMGARIRIWDYWRTFAGDPFETPYSKINGLQADMQYLRRLGVKDGYFVEYYGAYKLSFFQLTRWLGLKLMDDPDRDVWALIDRFMRAWYGPAAGDMRQWLDYLQSRLAGFPAGLPATPVYRRTYMDIPFFEKAYEIFDRAEVTCETGSVERTRVWRERMPVDTALLGLWPTLENGLAEGRSMPWERGAVLDRHAAAKRAVVESVHVPQTVQAALTGLDAEIKNLRTEIEQPPLPAAFAALPPDDVLDVLRVPSWNAPNYHRRVVSDPDAPGGMAVRLDTSELGDQPGATVPVGLYSPPKTFGPSLVFTPPTEQGLEAEWYEQGMKANRRGLRVSIPKDEAYHWYKLGPFRIVPGALLHAHASWYTQIQGLDRPLSLGYPEQDWYAFVAFKLEGPAYVEGSTKGNALSVGRVILVRGANPRARDFVP